MRRLIAVVVVCVALVAAACSGDDDDASPTTGATTAATTAPATSAASGPTTTTTVTAEALPAADAEELAALAAAQPGCDVLDPRACLLPFPNDRWLVPDAGTDTGYRVELPREAMPANKDGIRIDPSGWAANDGFSPGSAILTFVPGLDATTTGLPPVTDIGRSLELDSPTVLLDAESGERWPHWAELDAQATSDDERLLIIRPATNLVEGHRYVVALRDLATADGGAIEAGIGFRALRDGYEPPAGVYTDDDAAQAERVFAALDDADIARDDIYLAWDFTVASERSLSERLLHLRDDGLGRLGGQPPTFVVNDVQESPEPDLGRLVIGTLRIPNYLTGDGGPGNSFVLGGDGLPEYQGSEITTRFTCIVPPRALVPGSPPARPSLYGHGLLGSDDQVTSGNIKAMAEEHGYVFCATKWLGMSEDDVPFAATAVQDFSKFPALPDRSQHGILAQLFLARLLAHPDGLVSTPAFQRADGAPVFDPGEVFYDGNSQGGILGAAATAVAQDWTQAVLGVPGMNYSLLLTRSVDFAPFFAIMRSSYPSSLDQTLILTLVQMLWDRGEGNGYAHHVTSDPYDDTPAKEVLLHVALGDHQVTPVAAEIMARTMDVAVHTPVYATDRTLDVEPAWGIDPIASYPHEGSALVVWDSSQPVQPPENVPPNAGEDPHSDPRNSPVARQQKAAFLQPDGDVIDVCAGAPCAAPHG